MQGKKSFLLYCDQIHQFEDLTDEQAGKLIKTIFDYVNDKNPVIEDQLIRVAFTPIKLSLKRDLEDWLVTCKKNKENGFKGGRPKTERLIEEPKKPNGYLNNPTEPKKADSDSDSDSDSERDISKEKIHNDIFRSMWMGQIWIESVCQKFKSEIDDTRNHLDEFRKECLLRAEFKNSEKEAKNHFINWIKVGNPIPKGKVIKPVNDF